MGQREISGAQDRVSLLKVLQHVCYPPLESWGLV